MTGTLQKQQGNALTFSIERVRGDGVHLTSNWRSFAEAAEMLSGKLPPTVSLHHKPSSTWKTGDRFAFIVSMRRNQTQKGPLFVWYNLQTRSLTPLRRARPARPDARAAALIVQLGSRSFSKREQAMRSLMRYGQDVAALLRQAMKDQGDLERRARCRRLLQRLRDRRGREIEAMVGRQAPTVAARLKFKPR